MSARLQNTWDKPYSRALSVNERLWLAADTIDTPFAIQMVCEGSGAIDVRDLRKAVELASAANPGSRLKLKGRLNSCRWIDTETAPPVREVDGNSWSGYSPEGAPFLETPFNVIDGPTCEVLLIHGDPPRAAFRAHHAVMDTHGIIFWAEEIFRALQGKPLRGSYSRATDWDVARSIQSQYRKPFPHDNLSVTGRAEGNEAGTVWGRRSIPGHFRQVLAQMAYQTAQEARRHGEGNVRFAVPIDLRSRIQGLRSTANLTIGIYIDVRPETTIDEIGWDIAWQLRQKRDCMIDRWDFLYRYIPISILGQEGSRRIVDHHSRGLYSISGLISNVGRLNTKHFSGGGFECRSIFSIPPYFSYVPLLLWLYGTDDTIELVYAAPRVLATQGRLNAAIDRIVSGLVPAGYMPVYLA
ncbi:MAG TPA: hypothetical protein PL180_01905 [Spirochaetota bacterium]|nr:hypothetical protein [Spirochaetota bacterium]